jgi:hypothetical protein
MGMHESGINYHNLIRDLAEMYPFDVPEVIIVELVANALDAKATCVSIDFDSKTRVLVITDNGKGMDGSQFEQYHDFAAGLKTRGQGIGFAGVGAKISFNVANRVVTETRSDTFEGGSNWYLESEKRLIWEDTPVRWLQGRGTRVEIHFNGDCTLSYSSTEALIHVLRRHYLPLFDITFRDLYKKMQVYSDLRFIVNGEETPPIHVEQLFNLDPDTVHRFTPKGRDKKRTGLGVVGLSEQEYPVAQDLCGVLLCTLGKVIKAEFFGQFPGQHGARVFGMVEVPRFVEFLTTAKTDFIRRGRAKDFASLYNPIAQIFKEWLTKIGVQTLEVSGTDETRRLERELLALLDVLPELESFYGTWAKRTSLAESKDGSVPAVLVEGVEITIPQGTGSAGHSAGVTDIGDQPGTALQMSGDTPPAIRAKPISRVRRQGPKVSFMEGPDRVELAWVSADTIIINSAHPCYQKTTQSSTQRRMYCMFAIASGIQRFCNVGSELQDLTFVDRMMAAWAKK